MRKPELTPFNAHLAGLFGLTLVFSIGCCVPASAAPSTVAITVLYGACVLVYCAVSACRQMPAVRWFAMACYAALLAAIFYGANGALDALHGANRARPDVASAIGGLELWFVLCPGAVSVALGHAVRSALAKRQPP